MSRCVLYSQSPSHESVAIVSYGKNMGWKLSNLFVPEISTKLDFWIYFQSKVSFETEVSQQGSGQSIC